MNKHCKMNIKEENIVNFFNKNVAFKAEFIDPNDYQRDNKKPDWSNVNPYHLFSKNLLLTTESELKIGEMITFELHDFSRISNTALQNYYEYEVCSFDDFSHMLVLNNFHIKQKIN